MARATQLLLDSSLKQRASHGGSLNQKKRKTIRPLDTRKPVHLVLKSSIAEGERSFRHAKHKGFIRSLVYSLAKRYGLRLYKFSHNATHLHLGIQFTARADYKRFIRVLTGQIAMRMMGGKKGQKAKGKFWDSIPFTRIVEFGKAFKYLLRYIEQNELESEGIIPYTPRSRKAKTRYAQASPPAS